MIIAQFYAVTLSLEPQMTELFAHVLCDGFLGGRNCAPITRQREFLDGRLNKPSILPLPVPIDETEYHYPMHLLNGDIYDKSYEQAVDVPLFKHSMELTVRALGGGLSKNNNSNWTVAVQSRWRHWDFYNDNLAMSLVLHHSSAVYMDANSKSLVQKEGSGPRRSVNKQWPDSCKTWATGETLFAKVAPDYNAYAV